MKKLMLLMLGILMVGLIGLVGVLGEENVSCTTNDDCVLKDSPYCCAGEVEYVPGCYHINETPANITCDPSPCPGLAAVVGCKCENNTCENIYSGQEESCDSDNLGLCTDEASCTDAGGYWYNEVCNAELGEDCPQWTPPAPGWCANGTEVPGEIDENGCQGHPTCVTDETEPGCPELTREECGERADCVYDLVRNKCRNRQAVKEGKGKGLKQWVSEYLGSDECPEGCTCTGSVIKCDTETGRVMTVVAGRSGNIIIQTKDVNASTKVELIKNKTGIFGNFSGRVKRLKFMPDQVKEKVLKKLKMRNCTNCSIELEEDGSYEMDVERTYRVLGIFPRKIVSVTKIDSETGEIVSIRRPWWRFLAVKSKE